MKRIPFFILLFAFTALCAACSTQPPAELPSDSGNSFVSTAESEPTSLPEQVPAELPLPENTVAPLEGHDRPFDTMIFEEQCRRLLPTFAPQGYSDWNTEEPSGILSVYFKSYVEQLFYLDTGREFEHTDGFTAAENYVTYGTKYFYLSEDTLRDWIRQDATYNAESDTVLLSDGLGCVIGAHFINVTRQENGFVIDYAISGPDVPRFDYAQLSFRINPDGSFRFTGNTYTGGLFSPVYSHDPYGGALATNKDGTLELVYGAGFNTHIGALREVFVRDTSDYANWRSLGFLAESAVSDAGFFSNGDIYLMDPCGLTVFRPDPEESAPIFTTTENFPCHYSVGSSVGRYLYAIRRDPETLEYIVIYSEQDVIEPVNRFQLASTYRVGRLDRQGSLTASWDTGVPVMYTVLGFDNVVLSKPGENEIEFTAVTQQGEKLVQVRFDLSTGICTPVLDFALPAEEETAFVSRLAKSRIGHIGLMLDHAWDTNHVDNDFRLLAAVESLYRLEHRQNAVRLALPEDRPDISCVYSVSDLYPIALHCFGFSRSVLDAYFHDESRYDAQRDAVMLGDGWGWMLKPEITNTVRSGEQYTIHYRLLTPDGQVAQIGCLTARLNGNDLQFLSNTPQETY